MRFTTTVIIALFSAQLQAAVIKKRETKAPAANNYMYTSNKIMEVWYPSPTFEKSTNHINNNSNKKNNMDTNDNDTSEQNYSVTSNGPRRFRYVDPISSPPQASTASSLSFSDPTSDANDSSSSTSSLSSIENINIKQKPERKPKKLMDSVQDENIDDEL
ncbi:hypothetical protein BJ944DRAFT_268833, partial [Cunninghamella echinulata]